MHTESNFSADKIDKLSGAALDKATAIDVMGWHLNETSPGAAWLNEDGKETGWYFADESLYRDPDSMTFITSPRSDNRSLWVPACYITPSGSPHIWDNRPYDTLVNFAGQVLRDKWGWTCPLQFDEQTIEASTNICRIICRGIEATAQGKTQQEAKCRAILKLFDRLATEGQNT
jgi:hypothetical protein